MRIANRKFSFHHFSQLLWLFAIALVGWTLSQLPLHTIFASISALNLQQWTVWIGLNIALVVVANLRWWLLIRALKQSINFSWLMRVKQAGQAVSFITPGPQCGGEPLQIFWLYKRGLALHKALLSLGLDRIYEVVINLLVLLTTISILFASNSPIFKQLALDKLTTSPLLIVSLMTVAVLAVFAIWIKSPRSNWLGGRLHIQLHKLIQGWAKNAHLNQIKNQQQALVTDWKLIIRNEKPALFIAIFLSLFGWLLLLGELALLLNFAGVEFNMQAFLLIVVALRLAILLPIPAGIGAVEAAIYWAMLILNLPASTALSLIAFMRIRDILVLLSGLACWKWIQSDSNNQHKITAADSSL